MTIVRGLEAIYILKGVGEPEFYLGGNVSKAKINGKIRTVLSAKTYIKNCSEKIEKLFSTKLRLYGSPMDPRIKTDASQSHHRDLPLANRNQSRSQQN